MPLSIEEALARVPQWNGKQDIQTSILSGGITNQNFKVQVDGEAFVLRIGGENTELLGVNREVEYACSVEAAKIGISPDVIYHIEPEHYLVTRFIEGTGISPEEIGQPENIRRIMQTLTKIHALPRYRWNSMRFVM